MIIQGFGIIVHIHQFSSYQGPGADFFIESKTGNNTVYVQVVLYDERAKLAVSSLKNGDQVQISGSLIVHTYTKKNNEAAISLTVENPEIFHIIKPQDLMQEQQCSNCDAQPASANSNAETNSKADTAIDDDDLPF